MNVEYLFSAIAGKTRRTPITAPDLIQPPGSTLNSTTETTEGIVIIIKIIIRVCVTITLSIIHRPTHTSNEDLDEYTLLSNGAVFT